MEEATRPGEDQAQEHQVVPSDLTLRVKSLENLVVCTLCSCYRWPVLGLPPVWYNAHFLGEKRQHVYSVRFAARELWGEIASPRDSVHLDLWDDYLERA